MVFAKIENYIFMILFFHRINVFREMWMRRLGPQQGPEAPAGAGPLQTGPLQVISMGLFMIQVSSIILKVNLPWLTHSLTYSLTLIC